MTYMTHPHPQKHGELVCSVCGKFSEKLICGACADKIRAEALAKKKQQEKGQ